MKKILKLSLIMLMQLSVLSLVSAQTNEAALVPLPSVDDFTRGQDGWAFGLGLGIEYETEYEGSDEFGFESQPAGAIQWRDGDNIYYFAGEALGWRGKRSETWLFDVLLGFDEGREEADSDDGFLDGLGDQEEGFELVIQARYSLTSDWRYWVVSRLVVGDEGNLGLLGMGYRFGEQLDGTGSEINLVAVFHDSDYANKGFGINALQAEASGLQETSLSGGLRSIGIDYNLRYNINENWQFFGEALFEYFNSEVRDSPIARSSYEAEVGIGVIYIF